MSKPAGRPQIAGIKRITLNLREQDIATARKAGGDLGLPYQAVLRRWVAAQALAVRFPRANAPHRRGPAPETPQGFRVR